MTDAMATPHPATPAEVASAVLDAIETRPDAFNMDHWALLPDMISLAPKKAPACGSQLCAAGWTAHLTGWTLVELPYDQQTEVIALDEDGDEYDTLVSVYAERGNERRMIGDVAAQALGLRHSETFWYAEAPIALKRLREIAGR
ncbi:hypothetical protein [Streptomyces sp. NBC_01092]|uniref:hypothetical protein n=1 Tax=Streptomyces sp. NBC_01092 TaxID=2903748 RepID=UPI0038650EBC|nr:hypothetical protein OG254_00060 [Streptomyces sp. NBC_01092]WSU55761.1 hypothetical protein OG254_49365 [Streptomyces sp. NBC_01092]